MMSFYRTHRLTIEFIFVFVLLPVFIAVMEPRGRIYLILWLIMIWTGYILKRDYDYNFKQDWNFSALTRDVRRTIFLRFLPCAAGLLAFTWFMIPERLFSFPLERPLMWLMVMILYPLLSVVPQEIIFRSFFLRRYAKWFDHSNLGIIANALAFGWMHLMLQNWVAVVFSAIGGYLFMDTYKKTRSLAACSFEHALYGCYLFTIGLGWYFYHGNMVK